MFTEQLLGHLTKAYDILTHLINLIGTYFCGKWSCLPHRHINFSILKSSLKNSHLFLTFKSLKNQFSHKLAFISHFQVFFIAT